MPQSITATELARNLSDFLNRVRYRGEHFVIERNGEPVAALTPAPGAEGVTVRELVARLGHLAMPGEGFADDLEAIQSSQPAAEIREWPS